MNWSPLRVIVPGIAVILSVSVLSVSLAYADPPGAGGSSGGSGGCSGQSCFGSVFNQIHLNGNTGNSGNPTLPASYPPVHCWMQPWMTGPDTYTWWNAQSLKTLGSEGGQAYEKYVPQIDQHKNDGPNVGMWYQPGGDGTMANFSGSCTNLPLMEWVPVGHAPKEAAQYIPPELLANYAYANLQIPTVTFDLNPGTKTEVNLPTFVTNIQGLAPVSVTATIQGTGVSVTVTATPGKPTVSVQGGTDTGATYSQCGLTGSTDKNMDTATVGDTPDCGVVFKQPTPANSPGWTVTVADNWTASWTGPDGVTHTIGPPVGPAGTRNIVVQEIQSMNGG